MNTRIFLSALILACAGGAQATLYNLQFGSEGSPLGVVVPDGSTIGVQNDQTVNIGSGDVIGDLNVVLYLTGGYNGDLYGYLVSPDGTRVDLINRIGTAPLGNMSSGLDVILDDAAGSSIQNLTTGTGGGLAYQASGTLSSFNDGHANGTWTLYLADLSGGDGNNLSTLIGWGLQIEAVPEPTTWALVVFAVVPGSIALSRTLRNRKKPIKSLKPLCL